MIKQFKNYFNNTQVLISCISCTIIFSFLDKSLSNLFLLITFIISILMIQKNYNFKSDQINKIALAASLFSISIIPLLIYHNSSISYFDNFSRILLLLPIMYALIGTNLNSSKIIKLLVLCSLAASLNYIFFPGFDSDSRYTGTSSVAITYGNMLMLLTISSLFFLIENNSKNKYIHLILLTIILITVFLWSETETRGSLIGLLFCFLFIIITMKKAIRSLFILIFILVSVSLSNDSFFNRLDDLHSSLVEQNIGDTDSTLENASINERLLYYKFSYTKIIENPLVGIGPQNYESSLKNYLDSKNLHVTARGHAHNDFLDIAAKYGLLPIIFFIFFIYVQLHFYLKNLNASSYSSIGLIIMISNLSNMLTQSQFAHHQPTVLFLICLFFCNAMISNELEKK